MRIQVGAGQTQLEDLGQSRWPIYSGVGEPPLFISIIPALLRIPQMSPHERAILSHPIKNSSMRIYTRESLRNDHL